MKVFIELERDWQLTSEISDVLGKYVCRLYGSTNDSVDVTRYDMFTKKETRENRAIDSQYCHHILHLYLKIKRANFLSGTWKKKGSAHTSSPNIDEHGQQADDSIDQITEPYPDGIYNFLLEKHGIKTDSEESYFYESDIESDEDGPQK